MSDNIFDDWISTNEAVAVSGCSRLQLYIKRKLGEITTHQLGRAILYRREEMERLKQEREEKEEGKQ